MLALFKISSRNLSIGGSYATAVSCFCFGSHSMQQNTHQYLHAKIQIGNSKGPVSYALGQTVFHHDDIPEDRRQRKHEVKSWLKTKILNPDPPSWNKSTDPQVPVCERRTRENFVHDRTKAYQYNYRAENLNSLKMTEPIDRPTKTHVSAQLESTAVQIKTLKESNRVQRGMFNRTAEMPVHENLQDATPWNNSTLTNPVEKERKLKQMTEKSQNWTSKVNDTLPQKTAYIGPLRGVIELQNEIRRQKKEGVFSTKRQVNRPASEPVDRRKLRNRFSIEKPNKVTMTEHSGVWEMNKLEGKSMWSDTGSSDYYSKGDKVKTVNLDAYNFAGPNMTNNNKFRFQKGVVTSAIKAHPQ